MNRSWRSALAETTPDPRATVTREAMARLGFDARSGGGAAGADDATVAAPRDWPFGGRSTLRLPTIDVRLGAPSTDPADDLAVRELLAEGGMGRVYLAEQRSLAREVAIKTVKDPLDAAQLDALLWEGAIAGHLDHPGVTPIHSLGTSREGQPILVMKRIVGTRWSDLFDGGESVWARFPMLPKNRLRAHLDVLMEVARTVHFAHRRGVLHLDIKPDNVMIGELGEVYVVDWGVATPVSSAGLRGGFVGTPIFVAPEVVTGEEVGPWTDVYLLGATLHWVLTQTPRHRGETFLEILAAAEASAPIAYGPDTPLELADLANAATSRARDQRPADALAFRGVIQTHLEHTASLALTRDGERLLEEAKGAPSTDAALRLAAEARFAFRAAIERWTENPQARAGLEICLEKAASLELSRENLAGALELERELRVVPADLSEKRRRLEALLASRAESTVELKKLRDDADLVTGSRERALLVLVLVILSLVGLVGTSLLMSGMARNHVFEPLLPPLGGLVVFSATVYWLRRGLLANAAGRRLMLVFFFVIVFLGAHRVGTYLFPIPTDAAEIRSELLLGAALTFGLATFVSSRVFFVPLIASLGAIAVTFVPEHATLLFNASALGMLLGLIFVFRRMGMPREPTERP